MAERGLRALEAKNYVPRTSDGKADKPSPNRLLNAVIPTAPETVWAGDITFIPTTAGWLYLAVVIDLCSRRILAWSTADNLRADWLRTPFSRPSNHAAQSRVSFPTVTGAVNMAANSSEASLRRPGLFRVCPQRPTLGRRARRTVFNCIVARCRHSRRRPRQPIPEALPQSG